MFLKTEFVDKKQNACQILVGVPWWCRSTVARWGSCWRLWWIV